MANLKRPGNGGYRPGGGRKSKTDEEKIKRMAINAIKERFGSVEAGFIAMLDSREPQLIKFVFEHAVGKPKEQVEKKVEHTHHLRVGYGDKDGETDDIQDVEIVEDEEEVKQTIQLPGNAD